MSLRTGLLILSLVVVGVMLGGGGWPVRDDAPYLIGSTGAAQPLTSNKREPIDVRAFGAACDGVTDDATAIQAAIDAVPSTGGEVIIPAGHQGCVVSRSIRLKPNLDLVGKGVGAQSAIRGLNNVPVLELDNSCCRSVGPLYIRNLHIRTGAGPSAHGLYLNRVFLATLDKVFIDSSNQTSLATLGGNGIRFVNVTNSSILNSTLGSLNRVGIYIANSNSITVSNDLVTENISDGIQTLKSTYLVFIGNQVTENNGDGLQAVDGGGFFGPDQQGIVVSGNIFRANGKALLDVAATNGDGIKYIQTAGTVSGNVLSYNYGHGVELRNTANVTVVGNDISANGAGRSGIRNGVELEAATGQRTSDVVVLGNRIHDDRRKKTQNYAVVESGDGMLGPNIVEGNDVRGNIQAVSILVHGPGTIVDQNLGFGASTITRFVGATVLTFGRIPAQMTVEQPVSVPGVAVGMVATCSPTSDIGTGLTWSSWIREPDRILVRVGNMGHAATAPKAVTWRCEVTGR